MSHKFAPEGTLRRVALRLTNRLVKRCLHPRTNSVHWEGEPLDVFDAQACGAFLGECCVPSQERERMSTLPAAELGKRARQLFDSREEVRRLHPLALTPAGIRSYCQWML